MDKHSLPLLQVFAKRKNQKDPNADLYLRVHYGQDRHDKSLGIKCVFEDWDSEKMVIAKEPVQTHVLKEKMEELKQKLMGAYYLLRQEETEFSLQELLDVTAGNRKPGSLSFCQCFRDLIARMEKAKGNEGNSDVNIKKHKRCLEHFLIYCRKYYNVSDLPFHRINRTAIDMLTDHFKSDGKCSHNTTLKYMQIIKKVYRIGLNNGWVKMNAFADFKFRMKTVDRDFLSEKELDRIQKKDFDMPRLEQVRDLFIFSCFTGLAYIDVKNLKRKNIVDNNGAEWIKNKRTKTGVEASIPLLPPARQILEKYHPDWKKCEKETLLFNLISNQKMNAYLKEIADVCKIDKVITFHLARHTFATTVTLSNDIPLETVSKMLGHSRITMTQHYSKVIDQKIARDTQKLHEKFSVSKT